MNPFLPKWERLGQERPFWYVDMTYDEDPKRFWNHEREQAQSILETVTPYNSGRDTVLEIGRGSGISKLPFPATSTTPDNHVH